MRYAKYNTSRECFKVIVHSQLSFSSKSNAIDRNSSQVEIPEDQRLRHRLRKAPETGQPSHSPRHSKAAHPTTIKTLTMDLAI